RRPTPRTAGAAVAATSTGGCGLAIALVRQHHRGLDLAAGDRPIPLEQAGLLRVAHELEPVPLVEADGPRRGFPRADQHRLARAARELPQQDGADALIAARGPHARVADQHDVALVLDAHDADDLVILDV